MLNLLIEVFSHLKNQYLDGIKFLTNNNYYYFYLCFVQSLKVTIKIGVQFTDIIRTAKTGQTNTSPLV